MMSFIFLCLYSHSTRIYTFFFTFSKSQALENICWMDGSVIYSFNVFFTHTEVIDKVWSFNNLSEFSPTLLLLCWSKHLNTEWFVFPAIHVPFSPISIKVSSSVPSTGTCQTSTVEMKEATNWGLTRRGGLRQSEFTAMSGEQFRKKDNAALVARFFLNVKKGTCILVFLYVWDLIWNNLQRHIQPIGAK